MSNELSTTARLELHNFLLQLVPTANNLMFRSQQGAPLVSQQNLEIAYNTTKRLGSEAAGTPYTPQ